MAGGIQWPCNEEAPDGTDILPLRFGFEVGVIVDEAFEFCAHDLEA